MTRRKRVTIVDIAKELKYSIATVSRALNDAESVKESTRAKIKALAEKYRYYPNAVARSLVQKESRTIGFIFPDIRSIYYQVPQQFSNALEHHNYRMMGYYSNRSIVEQRKHIDHLLRQQVDGLIVCPLPGTTRITQNELQQQDRPYVFFNRHVHDNVNNKVIFDFDESYRKAISHVVSMGKKNFCFMEQADLSHKGDRKEIVKDILKHEKGIDFSVVSVGEDLMETGYHRMRDLVEANAKVDAVLCPSDFFAMGVIRACYDFNFRVPEDVSVLGCYESAYVGKYTVPRLSSIQCDFSAMAKESVGMLLRMIDGVKVTESRKIPTHFVKRETT